MAKKKPLSFEEGIKRLEELVELLQEGDIRLEDALKYYKEGMELSLLCSKQLEEAEKQVVELQKDFEGKFVEKVFDAWEKDNEL
ncbi:MAG TPA: exodeoxyribonuclease VII small subunit [Defluviitaleaceae bacterium]|nr:exodeoxyribonuclease VII small subunit [Candidatus Epulonipiscium sp.]HOQ16379.1 exodeoxyribonuclease VII small subunit [Defluviitaleaceae bacterium]HPT75804.1 exodeoxyribonuclease VII small subunit [Defluviitaleaceae bacterium]HQD51178.1 exodeoxyribonuclease VII small subunit [Defluviitaleaceae bacterium]